MRKPRKVTAPKANYRVFDKVRQIYCKSGDKRVWHLEYAVANFIKEITVHDNIDNFEVHKFPVESAIIINSREFIHEVDERTKLGASKKMKAATDYERRLLLNGELI